nr:immunoglobulin light chain junction region [Macaca mulatta]
CSAWDSSLSVLF